MPAWRTSWNRSWRSGSHDGVVLLDHEPSIAVAGGDVVDKGSEACGAGCQIGPVPTRGVVDRGLDLHCGRSRDDAPPTAGLLVLHVDPPLTWQHESTHDLTDGLGVADCHGGDDVARPLGRRRRRCGCSRAPSSHRRGLASPLHSAVDGRAGNGEHSELASRRATAR